MDTGLLNELSYLLTLTVCVMFLPILRKSFVPVPVSSASNKILKKEESGRYKVFDSLRGVAMLAVILIHTVYLFPLSNVSINVAVLESMNTALRFALPIFYITSGMFLIAPERTVKGFVSFYWKRIISIIPAYVLVTGVLAFIEKLSWNEFWFNVYTGNGAIPFYFIIILFQLYLIYPFVEYWAKKRWFVYSAFFFSVVFQFFITSWSVFSVPTAFRFSFFFVWGIYMKDQFLKGTLDRRPIVWVGLVGICVIAYVLYPGMYYNMRPFYGLAMMMLLFIFFTSTWSVKKLEDGLAWIGSMSLWIFLTHFSLMEFLLPLYWKSVSLSAYSLFFTSALISIALSIVFGFACMKLYNSSILVLKGNVKDNQ
jgi:peptidoglycan/LPS O-acetylase OafA/YrhL